MDLGGSVARCRSIAASTVWISRPASPSGSRIEGYWWREERWGLTPELVSLFERVLIGLGLSAPAARLAAGAAEQGWPVRTLPGEHLDLATRPAEVLDEIYDLFIDLDATEDQLDFPVIYTNAKLGTATRSLDQPGTDLRPLLDLLVRVTPAPTYTPGHPLQLLVTNLSANEYVGRMAVGPSKYLLLAANNSEINRRSNGMFLPGLLLGISMSPSARVLLGAQLAREDLESGFTTVRNLGHSGIDGDVALRDAINAGRVSGPRMLAAGRKLIAPGAYIQPEGTQPQRKLGRGIDTFLAAHAGTAETFGTLAALLAARCIDHLRLDHRAVATAPGGPA